MAPKTHPKKIELWARLGSHVESNGRREHSLRGILKNESGILVVYPLKKQDSSLISELNKANCLITLAPNNPPLPTGTLIKILPFYTEFN